MMDHLKTNTFKHMRSRVFLRLFRVNLALCMLSIFLLSIIVLPFLFRTANENDGRINEAKLQACQNYLDSELMYAANVANLLQKSNWVSSLYVDLAAGKPVSYDAGREVQSDLRNFCINHAAFYNITVFYYHDMDTIFNRFNFAQNREMMQSLFPDDVGYAVFPLDGASPGFSTVTYADTSYLTYRTSFQTSYNAKPKGEICVFFSTAKLQQDLHKLLGDNVRSLEICSKDGTVLHTIFLSDSTEADSAISVESDLYDYRVTMTLYSSRRHVIERVSCAIILDLLASLILALFLTSLNYRPFGNIVRQFVDELPPEEDEFAMLSQSIQQIQDICEERESALAKLQPMVEISAVHQLLNGGLLTHDEIDEELALYGITFPYPLFNVISISLVEPDDTAIIGAVLESLVTELSAYPDLVAYLRSFSNNGFHILVNYQDEAVFEKLLADVDNNFHNAGLVRYHMGIGSPQIRPEQLYLSCEQADTALNAASLQHSKLERFDALRSPCSKDYYYPLSEEVLLSHAIAENQMEKACEILHNVIERNCNNSDQQKNLSLLFFNLYTTIARSISGLNIQIPYYDSFPSFPFNGTQLYKQLEDLLLMVSAQLADKRESEKVSLEQQILEYIDHNLFSPDLSLIGIAAHFNKSTGYISIVFKRERGMNYNNYVNQKRIEQAVKLMASNTMDLQSICDAVGYTNLARFTKNFHKYTGHDPI